MDQVEAVAHGHIDEVMGPQDTRWQIIRALEILQNTPDTTPRKKHGNLLLQPRRLAYPRNLAALSSLTTRPPRNMLRRGTKNRVRSPRLTAAADTATITHGREYRNRSGTCLPYREASQMNRVTRISRIRNLGVFRQFDWPSGLADFERYNLIYGWNWSGKTLLSRVFASLQRDRLPECEDITVGLSEGGSLRRQDFGTASQHVMVRVFNRDFVDESVFGAQGLVGPIVVLGAESVGMQKDLAAVNGEIETKRTQLSNKTNLRAQKRSALGTFCTDGARVVRETLRSAGPTDAYANYERPDFIQRADGMADAQPLDDEEHNRLLAVVRAEPRSSLDSVSLPLRGTGELFQTAKELCRRSVVSNVIDDLRGRPEVNVWAATGLELHQKYGTKACLFCDQPLPKERLDALEAHFSREYTRLVEDLDAHVERMRAERQEANALQLPDEGLFYPDMRAKYRERREALEKKRQEYLLALDGVVAVLQKKKADPFRDYGQEIPDGSLEDNVVVQLNENIREHNARVQSHEQDVQQAKQKIERSLVAQRLPEYRKLKEGLNELDGQVRAVEKELADNKDRRNTLELSLVEQRRPAAELNRDVARYLGHHELQFDVQDTGYRIVRNGSPAAESLSEGEKTAIAVLYFLKSLEDKDFDIKNGIVVIDDPVSSLDSNALYYAFGFMKSRVRDAGQLFILTHNFLFFRQVKNWFEYLAKNKEKVCYHMLEVRTHGGNRCSTLVALDPLLKKFESEYHYLFSLVYSASQAGGHEHDLKQHYYLPNVARRLLEAFLQFKFPGNDSFYAGLEKANLDPAKKTRIYRFCQTHSHNQVIDEPEHDPSILGEAIPVAKDIMELIEEVDHVHFEHMIPLVARAQRDESAP